MRKVVIFVMAVVFLGLASCGSSNPNNGVNVNECPAQRKMHHPVRVNR